MPEASPHSLMDAAGTAPVHDPSAPRVVAIPLDAIATSQRNPRRKLNGIDDLAASMATHGLLQPVLVRTLEEDNFELVAGHRRLAAARQLGWQSIPAIVRSVAQDEAYLLTIIENLQREDLSPREEAEALAALVQQRHWSTHQVAAAIQRSQAFVSKRLRVFEDHMLAPAVLAGDLTVSAAEELLSVPEEHRYEVAARAIENAWDVSRIRTFVRSNRFDANRSPSRRPGLYRRVHELRLELRELFPEDLGEIDRRELRLFFKELASLAQARPGAERVFPALPAVGSTRAPRAR